MLFREITETKGLIKKNNYERETDDKLYQKFKMYFLFDLIKKKVSKMKQLDTTSTSTFQNKIKIELRDIDDLFVKKTKKEKYKNYSNYFKIIFDKSQKGRVDEIDLSLAIKDKKIQTQTFAYPSNRKDSLNKGLSSEIEEDKDKIYLFSESIYTKEELIDIIDKMITTSYKINPKDYVDYNHFYCYSFPFFNSRKIFLFVNFAEFFKEKIFNNQAFKNLIHNYKKQFYYTYIDNSNISYLSYPYKVRNYLTKNNKIRIFLKPDLKFFSNDLIKISHATLYDFLTFKNSFTTFKNRIYENEKIILSHLNDIDKNFECELITIEGAIYGRLILSANYISFISDCDNDPRIKKDIETSKKMPLILSSLESDILNKKKIILIRYQHIDKIYIRRFLYSMQANEFHLKNNKTYFFNLLSEKKNTNFLSLINNLTKRSDLIIKNLKQEFAAKNYTNRWMKNELSTFDYLSMLNFYSCRSFNDVNQYPVFPWLTSLQTNNKNTISIRNFAFPVSVQEKDKRNQIIKKFCCLQPSKSGFVNHFNSHYSTSAFVSFFMVRTNPFTYNQIKLQNNQFDHPNRTFHSFYEILEILIKYSDNRELISEIFYFPEMFINLNFNNLGRRTNDKIRNHNVLFDEYYENNRNINNPSSNNPVEFMCRYKRLLESEVINSKINQWINNIFGVYQLIDNYEENKVHCNTFTKYCYEEKMNFEAKIEKYKKNEKTDDFIWRKLRGIICCVLNFGQTPQKLLETKLLEKASKKVEIPRKNFSVKSKSYSDLSNLHLKDRHIPVKNTFSEYDSKPLLFFESIKLSSKSRIYFILQKSPKILDIFTQSKEDKKINRENSINISSPIFGYYDLFKSPIDKTILPSQDKIKNVYDLRHSFASFYDGEILAFSNYCDNSIKFVFKKRPETMISFITSSFVTAIVKVSENKFITGHENGMLAHWIFSTEKNELRLHKIKSVICQQSEVVALYYEKNANIVINGDNDGVISIRNLYSFELITSFKPAFPNKQAKLLLIKFKINKFNNLLYILAYDPLKGKYILFGYTVNGIRFSFIEDIAGSFHILENGNIMCYCYTVKAFIIVRGECLDKFVEKFDCDIKGRIVRFNYIEEDQKIYYLKKTKILDNQKRGSLFLDVKDLTYSEIQKINKEEHYKEGNNISIWDNIEYDNEIIEHQTENTEEYEKLYSSDKEDNTLL